MDTEKALHERFGILGELQGRGQASSAEWTYTRRYKANILCPQGVIGK